MDWLRKVVESRRPSGVIMALILINAVTLGLETSASAMERYGPLLIAIDLIAIAIFVVEILARLFVQRAAFFRDGWNIFDMVVVGVRRWRRRRPPSRCSARFAYCVVFGDHRRACAAARGRRPDQGAARHGLDPAPDRPHLLCGGGDGR